MTTKEQALEHLSAIERETTELRLIIDQPEKPTAEQKFLDLWDGTTNVLNEQYPQSIFLKKDNKVLFEQDLKNKLLLCDYYPIWSVFQTEYLMDYYQTQAFIKNILENHLNIRGLKPVTSIYASLRYWKNI